MCDDRTKPLSTPMTGSRLVFQRQEMPQQLFNVTWHSSLLAANSSTEQQARCKRFCYLFLCCLLALVLFLRCSLGPNERVQKWYLILSIKVNEVNVQLTQIRPWLYNDFLALFDSNTGHSITHLVYLLESLKKLDRISCSFAMSLSTLMSITHHRILTD